MKMPLDHSILAGVKSLVSIDTRNAGYFPLIYINFISIDYSATGLDGLLWTRAGYYTMYVYSYPNGLTNPIEE